MEKKEYKNTVFVFETKTVIKLIQARTNLETTKYWCL